MDLTAILISLVGAIVSITGIYFAFLTAKLNKAITETSDKVVDLKEHVNSRMDKMIVALEAAAVAKGHLAGVEAEKIRRDLQDKNRAIGALKRGDTEAGKT